MADTLFERLCVDPVTGARKARSRTAAQPWSRPMGRSDIYEQVYRDLHPRTFPLSPWERQRELRDLWPAEQQKFRDMVDAAGRRALQEGGRE